MDKSNMNRCNIALVLSILFVICVFIGVVYRVLDPTIENQPGANSFKMFTVISALLASCCIFLSIPYQIEGIRNNNYHLPRWIVNLLYIATSCEGIVLFVTLFLASPRDGFVFMMIEGDAIVLHTLGPITAMVLFLLINTDHNIKFPYTIMALIPVFLFSIVYYTFVVILANTQHAWDDFYGLGVMLPWGISILILYICSFLIANTLRIIHNKQHKKHKNLVKNYYLNSKTFNKETIEEAIAQLAIKIKKDEPKTEDLRIPVYRIKFIKERFSSQLSIEQLCEIYLRAYFHN